MKELAFDACTIALERITQEIPIPLISKEKEEKQKTKNEACKDCKFHMYHSSIIPSLSSSFE